MANQKTTYKQMAGELDALMAWFDSDQVDLDEAVKKYEQAVKLIEQMQTYLKTAENKVVKISAKFE